MSDGKKGRRRRSSSLIYQEPTESMEHMSDQSALPNLNANWVNAKGMSLCFRSNYRHAGDFEGSHIDLGICWLPVVIDAQRPISRAALDSLAADQVASIYDAWLI